MELSLREGVVNHSRGLAKRVFSWTRANNTLRLIPKPQCMATKFRIYSDWMYSYLCTKFGEVWRLFRGRNHRLIHFWGLIHNPSSHGTHMSYTERNSRVRAFGVSNECSRNPCNIETNVTCAHLISLRIDPGLNYGDRPICFSDSEHCDCTFTYQTTAHEPSEWWITVTYHLHI